MTTKTKFDPPAEFAKRGNIGSSEEWTSLRSKSLEQNDLFWRERAKSLLHWDKPFTKGLEWKKPFASWFEDGEINAANNCVDRHRNRSNPAIIWEGEPGDIVTWSYEDLYREVTQFATALSSLGYKAGDVATIYMPMIPQTIVAMLACARLGITHSVVFAGFSASAIAERNRDAGASLVITADGGFRRGQIYALKPTVDEALTQPNSIRNVIVYNRTSSTVAMQDGRDHEWMSLVESANKCGTKFDYTAVSAEHPLFILYTSGSTGKPKGIVHSTGGYLLGAGLSFKTVFDLKSDDIFWCTADAGWITGHTYVVYGPLSQGATVFIYEGVPNQPDFGRFWQMIERHKVSILYTAPTAIRSFMKDGDEFIDRYDLSSLRLLGTVGESINPEAWMWYRERIGKSRCPIVDTWWQTETGSIMISPIPSVTSTAPGCAAEPFLGIDVDVVDESGTSVSNGEKGYLVIRRPWPSMLRGIRNDVERYKAAYWNKFPGLYFAGDGAIRDQDGHIWVTGRVDDVLNVSGHRLSTAEIESAASSHPAVAESAVVGIPHEIKGEVPICFVCLKTTETDNEALRDSIREHVAKSIGHIAKPDRVIVTDKLPKTRSGKIMRRFLRDIAQGKAAQGDMTTLEDPAALKVSKT